MSRSLIYTIDDDADFNMVLKMALKNHDIDVITHTGPEDFIKSVKQKKPDLCIIDLNLDKGGEGFQLLKAMRNVIGSTLPIFIMSKRGSEEDVSTAMEIGATDFIPKPLDDMYLLLKLKHYLQGNKKVQDIESHLIKVSENENELSLFGDYRIKKLSLDNIELEGDVFLLKEMVLNFSGDIFKEIFNKNKLKFKIQDSWQIDESKFGISLIREYSHEDFMSFRRWLISKQFIYSKEN